MRVRYKIIKADAKQKEFMEKHKACSCMYCDYAEGIFCTFRGKKCPAGEGEYLEKIYLPRKIKYLTF